MSVSVQTAIIGGGFAGLGVAIALKKRGFDDFVILEKAQQLGGTWRENTYPGCACDVPSHLYSFSFARKHPWSRVFAGQAEIQRYLLDVADQFGVLPHVRFGTEVTRAEWNGDNHWHLSTSSGEEAGGAGDVVARFLVSGQGPLHEARVPALPGLRDFAGVSFHSSRWRHDVDLRGRRVAVIGTGSSAIQFVPHVQKQAEQLYVFQRTAPWVLPKPDHRIPDVENWIFQHVPGAQRAVRGTIYGLTELLQRAQRSPSTMQRLQKIAVRHLERQVQDPALRAQLTPTFTLACKRLLLSNDYYPALQRENARLVPHGVTRVEEGGVVAGGSFFDVDTIIFGTGFHVTDIASAKGLIGRGGRTLSEVWAGSPTAYLGTMVHGFPNAFLVIGPNLGNGHGSYHTLVEAQAGYIVDAIATAEREDIASLEPRLSAQRAWNEDVQAALATTVWNAGGCASYYLDDNGRNSTIYPWSTVDFRWRMRRFDKDAYEIQTEKKEKKKEKEQPPPALSLQGSVVVVTGGARGIGLATARRFADAGARVCLGDLDGDEARLAACTLGPHARGFDLDVTQAKAVRAFVERIEREVGPIEVFVNNAGVMPTGPFLEDGLEDGLDDEDASASATAMAVNYEGTAHGLRAVLPRMIARGRGHVVNVVSLAGKLEVPWMAAYVASKHAVVGLSGAVRTELEGTGVTLSIVMPGAVRTRLSAGIELDGLFAVDADDVAAEVVASVRTRETDIVVPRALSAVVPLYALAPRSLLRPILRALRTGRVVEAQAKERRASYERAVRGRQAHGEAE